MLKEISNIKQGYISAGEAAKMSHYTRDYVGQLCRSGKISSYLVGRVWYLDKEELLAYKRDFKGSDRRRKSTSSSIYRHGPRYERDHSPLLPPLSKGEKNTLKKISAIGISKVLVVFSLALFIGASSFALSLRGEPIKIAGGYLSNTASVSETLFINGFSKLRDSALNPYVHSRNIE